MASSSGSAPLEVVPPVNWLLGAFPWLVLVLLGFGTSGPPAIGARTFLSLLLLAHSGMTFQTARLAKRKGVPALGWMVSTLYLGFVVWGFLRSLPDSRKGS
ncbi:MAG: hypothetical protein HY558_07920 [Euryarchaeota archaeon]|nr:hypothetical protein [Euryarchaeota archaeon]